MNNETHTRQRLLHNEDCTQVFYGRRFPEGGAGETIDRYIDVLAGAGITELFFNTNARLTNYRSDVWESFWDAYNLAEPSDMIHNMEATYREGVDYPARVIARCRRHGIIPWISIRMNDVHYSDEPGHFFHGQFWKQNPQLRRQAQPDWFQTAFDYAHQEVRDHYQALIAESLERFDPDGIELDFMREPFLFSEGREEEGGRILTAWIRGIRTLVESAAAQRGHAVKLGVRVPSHVETARGLGMDAVTWAREGLVDLVVPCNRWMSIEYDMPIKEWKERLGPFQGTLAGGMDVSVLTCRENKMRCALDENDLARGAAVSILADGADALYLFNYFQPLSGDVAAYQSFMKSLSSLEQLQREPRTHAVTLREIVAPTENYREPLPASGRELTFALPLGPKPPTDWKMELRVEVEASTEGDSPSLHAWVNDVACGKPSEEKNADGRIMRRFPAAVAAVRGDGSDRIRLATDGQPVKVFQVETHICPV